MKRNHTPLATVQGRRRRMLGAIALAASPAVVPKAVLAEASLPGRVTPARPSVGGPLLHREGWLRAQGDR